MAIKLRLYEFCRRCGEKQVRRDADEPDILKVYHDCPNRPPGPHEPPKRFHISEVTFIEGRQARD